VKHLIGSESMFVEASCLVAFDASCVIRFGSPGSVFSTLFGLQRVTLKVALPCVHCFRNLMLSMDRYADLVISILVLIASLAPCDSTEVLSLVRRHVLLYAPCVTLHHEEFPDVSSVPLSLQEVVASLVW
jgi:hypothetical protein